MLKRTRKEIQNYDFMYVFDGKKIQDINYWKQDIQSLFLAQKIELKVNYSDKLKQTLVLISFRDETVIYRQAEALSMLKEREKKSFIIGQNIEAERKKRIDDKNYLKYLELIDSRRYNFQIYQQEKLSPFKVEKKDKFESAKLQFTSDEELRCKYNELLYWNVEKIHEVGEIMIPYLQYPFQQLMQIKGFVQLIPIQKPSEYRVPYIKDINWWYYGSVEKYVGIDVQVYFCLIRFMQRYLWLPILAGILTILFNRTLKYTVDNSPADTIYSFVILFWSIIFVSKWQLVQKWFKFQHATGFNQAWAFFQNKIIQDDGTLAKRVSLTTGQTQVYVPFWTNLFLRLKSWFTIFPIIILTVLYMVLSLNLRGFVDSQHKLLYWKFFSDLTLPGRIFDKQGGKLGFLVVIFHVVIINYVDANIYRKLVISSTKKQKHLETKRYQNSIIIKFLIYEAIITFTDLFYIAFVRFDIQGLKQQMSSLFVADILRRVISETFIPWLKRKNQSSQYKKQLSKGVIDDEEALVKQCEIQVQRPTYESFDDYLEIVTNFGYLVMLSSAFPSAPVWILLSHFLQIISDKYKILFLCKRALPKKFNGTGSWKDVLYGICYFSIITNIVLFAFSSQQIVSFFPRLFEQTKQVLLGNTDVLSFVNDAIGNVTEMFTVTQPVPGFTPNLLTSRVKPTQGKQTGFMLVIFVIQHFILFIFLAIRKYISNQKSLADIFKQRRIYKKSLKSKIDVSKNRQSQMRKTMIAKQ